MHIYFAYFTFDFTSANIHKSDGNVEPLHSKDMPLTQMKKNCAFASVIYPSKKI